MCGNEKKKKKKKEGKGKPPGGERDRTRKLELVNFSALGGVQSAEAEWDFHIRGKLNTIKIRAQRAGSTLVYSVIQCCRLIPSTI